MHYELSACSFIQCSLVYISNLSLIASVINKTYGFGPPKYLRKAIHFKLTYKQQSITSQLRNLIISLMTKEQKTSQALILNILSNSLNSKTIYFKLNGGYAALSITFDK